MAYIQGFLLAVPEENKAKYKEMAEDALEMFKGYGAIGFQENWGVNVPDGKVTSFPMATKMEAGEVCMFSWIVWPDRAAAEAAEAQMMADMDGKDMPQMPFDGMRMMWGGFEPLVAWGEGAVQ
ncbi:DUF1428 domain-containing protein [Vannielia litorea]|uniref:DUF1428 domain-containing protein n=1 Tax=Vannielia litorea TaxID=1217970 RepID=UPI001BD0A533|nr:DUF1428 domain-containing protein [Vannielia litorea]MBS8225651.1 DUF1428 domain-containing protein [Vannielia litorea]